MALNAFPPIFDNLSHKYNVNPELHNVKCQNKQVSKVNNNNLGWYIWCIRTFTVAIMYIDYMVYGITHYTICIYVPYKNKKKISNKKYYIL